MTIKIELLRGTREDNLSQSQQISEYLQSSPFKCSVQDEDSFLYDEYCPFSDLEPRESNFQYLSFDEDLDYSCDIMDTSENSGDGDYAALPLAKLCRAVHIGMDQVLVVGGEQSQEKVQKQRSQAIELLLLDLQNQEWKFEIFSSDEEAVHHLSEVQLTSLVHDPTTQKTYCIFGWSSEKEYVNDVHVLEPRNEALEHSVNRSRSAGYQFRRLSVGNRNSVYVKSYTDEKQTIPEQPSPKFGHTTTLIKDSHSRDLNGIYVFGGYGHGVFFNDLWRLDLEEERWSLVHSCADNPNQSTRASRLFKFRPLDTMDMSEDQESVIDERNFVDIPGFGEIPTRRYGHTAVYDKDRNSIVVFGGKTDLDHTCDNGLFRYCLKSRKWERMSPSRGVAPEARFGHSAICTRESLMFVFGGRGKHQFFNDLWMCDLSEENGCSWNCIELEICAPGRWHSDMFPCSPYIEARAFHNAWLESSGRELHILGGHNAKYESLNDCFKICLPLGTGRKSFRTNLNQFWRLGISSDCSIICQRK